MNRGAVSAPSCPRCLNDAWVSCSTASRDVGRYCRRLGEESPQCPGTHTTRHIAQCLLGAGGRFLLPGTHDQVGNCSPRRAHEVDLARSCDGRLPGFRGAGAAGVASPCDLGSALHSSDICPGPPELSSLRRTGQAAGRTPACAAGGSAVSISAVPSRVTKAARPTVRVNARAAREDSLSTRPGGRLDAVSGERGE